MSGPTIEDVLWLLDSAYGTDYGDVVRALVKKKGRVKFRNV